MASRRATLNSSRSEFLSSDVADADIEYKRGGGCFVTTKKALFFLLLSIIGIIVIVVLMYLYGPNRKNDQKSDTNDIEKLINDSLKDSNEKDFRLSPDIYPLHYKLHVHPILDEQSSDNFTFKGFVEIEIRCKVQTKQIVLHANELDIKDESVSVIITKTLTKRAIPENIENNGNIASTSNSSTTVSPTSETMATIAGVTPLNITRHEANHMSVLENATTTNSISPTTPKSVNTSEEDAHKPKITSATTITSGVPESLASTTPTFRIQELTIRKTKMDKKNSKYIIKLSDLISPDTNYTIRIKFSGKIDKNLKGLYRTSYKDQTGNIRWMATTFLQPTYARRVFPCFDEPSFKAPLDISIARRTNMTVLSNMPLRETTPMPNATGWVWDHFETSPPMSTYLVSFSISDFEYITSKNTAGPVIKIWAPRHSLQYANYSLSLGHQILSFMEDYFDIKYPLRKLDFIAIPSFPRDTMSSWGLISFKYISVLEDPDDPASRRHILDIIAEALSQQWFGALVTMQWWSDLWLSKGFATYITNLVKNALQNDSDPYNSFPLTITEPVLEDDSIIVTHSLHPEIKDDAQIEQLFDDIVYKKGACILRMLNYTLCKPVFKNGLRNYLKSWSYKSTTKEDLWKSMTDAAANKSILPSGLSVKEFLDPWIIQQGYPLITVERHYDTFSTNISQKRLLRENIPSETLWSVPISYILNSNNRSESILWLRSKHEIWHNCTPGNEAWLLFNIGQTGFYRVNYDKTNWKFLQHQLETNPNTIPTPNRAQIVNDALALASLGVVDYHIALNLTKYLGTQKETNAVPWIAAIESLQDIKVILRNTEYYGLFQDYIIGLVEKTYETLAMEDNAKNSINNKVLKTLLTKTLCELDYEPCVTWAKIEYKKWMNSKNPDEHNPIPHDSRAVVQCTAITEGGHKEWTFLFNRTLSPSISPSDLKVAYLSLGCTQHAWLIHRYLELSLNGNISLQNIPYVWKSLSHPGALSIGFKFLRANWKRIYAAYAENYSILKSIIDDFLTMLTSRIDLEDLTVFYKNEQTDLKSVAALVRNAVEKIKMRILWSDKYLEKVVGWFELNGNPINV